MPTHPSVWIPAVRRDSGIGSFPSQKRTRSRRRNSNSIHNDPFERVLIAQAIMGDLALILCD